MIKLKTKALSVNECWQGRRFKTKKYLAYEKRVLMMLPARKKRLRDKTKLKINIRVGFSTVSADLDNICKPVLDILQKKYRFNDRWIFKLLLTKELVTKGEEFIEFEIREIS